MTTPPARPEWVRCPSCAQLVYGKRHLRNLQVCPECSAPARLTAPDRIEQLVDDDSFTLLPGTATTPDVLRFTDTRPYPVRLKQARRDTELQEAVVTGTGTICAQPVVLAVMDFRFMGGSLGSAVGELITRAAEFALEQRLPLLIASASGGARMQEGSLSLMQMAKVSQALGQLQEAGLLTISLVTDPTYGGVAASYATNTDIVIAEAGARLGFAGPRVIEQTIRQKLPEGFQTAEFLLEHGQVDLVAERRNLRGVLQRLLTVARRGALGTVPDGKTAIRRSERQLTARDPWETVKLARHVDRPTTLDYLSRIFDSFVELHGDRVHGDCPAIIAGLALLEGHAVAVVGHQKGHTTRELVERNFGMPRPEGYRKALRVMELAERLGLPVVTLVDTPGAYPGLDAEERGQAVAVARNILRMSTLRTPVVSVVTGEGGSGGALGLAVADQVLILENGYYSVISPEGCSSILWGSAESAPEAARALRITAPELLRLGVVDGVVPEPDGGAHTDHAAAADLLRRALLQTVPALRARRTEELVERRRRRFRRFGQDAVSEAAQQTENEKVA